MKYALLLGATSDVGMACAHLFASKGYNLTLASRTLTEDLKNHMSDLKIRYEVSVHHLVFDATNFNSHETFVSNLDPKIETVISVFGLLGDHEKAIQNFGLANNIIQTNFTGNVSILGYIANELERKKKGTIACVSSVAGERGRMSNYIYGSAKAGLTAFLSGLRNRLAHSGVHVTSIQPGFIRTKMIEGIETPGALTATPQEVAKAIYKACVKQKNTVFVKPIWKIIMLIIRNIPEFIFKKLKL